MAKKFDQMKKSNQVNSLIYHTFIL